MKTNPLFPRNIFPLIEGRYILLETEILMFAARFPEQMNLLFDIGADLAIRTDGARRFWGKIRGHIHAPFDPIERKLLDQWRSAEAPPIEDGFENEYADLKRAMSLFQAVEDVEAIAEIWRAEHDID